VPQAGGGDGSVGFIFDLHGTWMSSRSGRAVGNLDPIFPGEIISAGKPVDAMSSVSFSLHDGTTPRPLKCRSAADCDRPYQVPAIRPPQEDFLTRAWRAIRLLNPSEVVRIKTPAVRGGQPEEAVIRLLPNSTVDLAPVMTAMDPGRYTAELRAWRDSGTLGNATSLQVEWRLSRALVTGNAISVAPGLYEITLIGTGSENHGRALVLVASGSNFESFRMAFQQIQRTTESWSSSSGKEPVRQFRAKYLIALDRNPRLAADTQ
jgi:hypothetical protein